MPHATSGDRRAGVLSTLRDADSPDLTADARMAMGVSWQHLTIEAPFGVDILAATQLLTTFPSRHRFTFRLV